MKKRFLVTIAVCMTMFSLAACGKTESTDSDKQVLDVSEVGTETTESVEVVDLSDTPVEGTYFGNYEEGEWNNIAFHMTEGETPTITFSSAKYGTLTGECVLHDNYIDFGKYKCDYIVDTNGNLTFTYKDIAYGMTQIDEETYNKVLEGRDVTELTLESLADESVESIETGSVDETETAEQTETEETESAESTEVE